LDKVEGIKKIQIHAKTTYPIISAYEFEFLMAEEEVKTLLRPCTIYFIIQRPLIYFDNFTTKDGVITFDLVDDTESKPLRCSFVPSENGFCAASEELMIKVMFYKKDADLTEPFKDVAAFKLLSLNDSFLGWFSPQKFIYEFLSGNISAEMKGNIADYIGYRVHYIGKAFSQDIWKRLTGHHKMQKILTVEDALNTKSLKAPFEISLLMLDIDGFDEMNLCPYEGYGLSEECNPILLEVSLEDDDDSIERLYEPTLSPRSPELTSEVEAMLVNRFKPEYNDILFENYPYIEKGTRSAGYSESTLVIKRLPAILKTNSHTQDIILPNCNVKT
jgi:hypothetical protein